MKMGEELLIVMVSFYVYLICNNFNYDINFICLTPAYFLKAW